MSKKTFVDVYCIKTCVFCKTLKKMESQLKNYVFSYYDINDPPPPEKVIGSIIIIEETSDEEVFLKFSRIYNSYKIEPFVLITSEAPDFKNAVKWMKSYATDYIDANEKRTAKEIDKIFKELILIEQIDTVDDEEEAVFHHPPVNLTVDGVFNELTDETNYQMSVLMATVNVNDEYLNIYTKEQIDSIVLKHENYITKRISNMGGYKLFWNYNSGAFLFYFGDRINLAVLAAISIINKINIYFIENYNMEKGFDIKLTLHDGEILFSRNETKFISSDAINTVAHMRNLHDYYNTLDITENIYQYLNPRLQYLFHKAQPFEGRQIYSYYLNFNEMNELFI